MRYKFFFIPALFPQQAEQELNAFISNHAVLSVDREFCRDGDNPGWSICVGWSAGTPEFGRNVNTQRSQRESVDYKEVLSEGDFTAFAQLRELRKKLSQESGQPVYQIFSNKQLAELVTRRIRNQQQMAEIEGIGQSRLKQYAQPFIELLKRIQGDEDQ